jgi:hypothetical protein
MSIFKDLAKAQGNAPLRIVPDRARASGPRDGSHLTENAQGAGNLFWRRGVQVASVVYSRIDARFPLRLTDPGQAKLHAMKMSEAKKILQEHRNQIFEAVLPMFAVYKRLPGEVWTDKDSASTDGQSADKHAQDFFVRNVFTMMVKSYIAWLPEFVDKEDVETVESVILRVAETQAELLEAELRNFRFGFRLVIARKV